MTGGFPGRLGVVRVHVARVVEPFVTVPVLRRTAEEYADELVSRLYNLGDSHTLVDFDRGDGSRCFIRARDVIAVDVVPTEDPGLDS